MLFVFVLCVFALLLFGLSCECCCWFFACVAVVVFADVVVVCGVV